MGVRCGTVLDDSAHRPRHHLGPGSVGARSVGSLGKAAILTAFGTCVIGLADNFIRPYVVSGRVDMHPLLVFVALLGGVQAFGFLGLFIGPATVSLAMAVFELLQPGPDSST